MRHLVVALVFAMSLAGCGLVPGPHDASSSGAMAHMVGDLGWGPCPVEVWVTGVIVASPDGFAAIRDDAGVVRMLTWGSQNSGVVDWGRRYRIGGRWFNTEDNLWACGGAAAVIPE